MTQKPNSVTGLNPKNWSIKQTEGFMWVMSVGIIPVFIGGISNKPFLGVLSFGLLFIGLRLGRLIKEIEDGTKH